jgi:hypothetical protein
MTLPIVDEITKLPSHADRADWLMRCPDWHVVGFVGSIRSALELAHFPEGLLYLEARSVCLQAVRTREGHIPNQFLTPLYIREGEMKEAARRRDLSSNRGAKHG